MYNFQLKIKKFYKMRNWTEEEYRLVSREMINSDNPFIVKLGEAIEVGNMADKRKISSKFMREFSKHYEKTLKQ